VQWLNGLNLPEQLERDQFIESPLCHPATMIRRTALEEVGAWRHGDFPEDYELWLRMLGHGWRLKNLPEVLFRWRDGNNRLTRTDPRYSHQAFLRVKAQAFKQRHGLRAQVWGAGPIGRRFTRYLQSEGVSVDTLWDIDPKKVNQVSYGLRVRHIDELGGPGVPMAVAVGAEGARGEIRKFLAQRGWADGTHFHCVA
jgi:cellulose synthase/poly-beta-1,6-N-acetylglucosamine synthase-like glycosyltransferase